MRAYRRRHLANDVMRLGGYTLCYSVRHLCERLFISANTIQSRVLISVASLSPLCSLLFQLAALADTCVILLAFCILR